MGWGFGGWGFGIGRNGEWVSWRVGEKENGRNGKEMVSIQFGILESWYN